MRATLDELVATNQGRATVYGFLSKVYEREVTIDFLKQLLGSEFMSQITSMGAGDKGFRLLSEYLRGLAGRDLEQVRLELAVEYAALFLGMRAGVYHPSESAYMTSTHFIMQEPRDAVLAIYRDACVEKAKDFSEPDDHIAMELQFMAHLCGKIIEALRSNKKAEVSKLLGTQRDFLEKHLLVWVPNLTNDMLKIADVDFYKAIATITQEFLELDKQTISQLDQEIAQWQDAA